MLIVIRPRGEGGVACLSKSDYNANCTTTIHLERRHRPPSTHLCGGRHSGNWSKAGIVRGKKKRLSSHQHHQEYQGQCQGKERRGFLCISLRGSQKRNTLHAAPLRYKPGTMRRWIEGGSKGVEILGMR